MSLVDRLRRRQNPTADWLRPFVGSLRIEGREILLFFEFPDGEIQVELSREGSPRVLLATQEPLLADPEQRRAYGIEARWPPDAAS